MLAVFFFIQSFSPIEIIIFNKYFLYPIEVIDFASSIVKRYFTSDYFFQSSGGLKIAKSCSGLNYARFEEFIHNAESVTRIIYALRIVPDNKIVPKLMEASLLVVISSDDSKFYTLIMFKACRFSVFSFPKNCSI